MVHDRIFLKPEHLRDHDGLTLFMIDSEGDGLWAFDPAADGNPVYHRDPAAESWSLCELTLRRFLLLTVAAEVALYGTYARCSWTASKAQAQQVTTTMAEVPHHPMSWPTPGARLYCGPETLAVVAPSWSDKPLIPRTFALLLAGRPAGHSTPLPCRTATTGSDVRSRSSFTPPTAS